jgi:hypothetical protein
MQLLLPIFPKETTLITSTLGVFEKDEFVFYLHSGVPISTHHKDNLKSFRYTVSKLIDLGLCRQADIVRTFSVSEDSIRKSLNLYRQKGEEGFFGASQGQRVCPAMLPDRLERIQKMLDKGMSNYSIAKKEKISEGTIRYALQTGKLKKTSGHTGRADHQPGRA